MERSNWRRRSRAELLWERAEGKREMAHFPRCQLNRVEWLAVNKKTPTIYSATFVPSVISRLWFLVFTEPLWFYAAVLLFPAETPIFSHKVTALHFFLFFFFKHSGHKEHHSNVGLFHIRTLLNISISEIHTSLVFLSIPKLL